MLALVIALFLIAVALGHLVKHQNAARRDREFYKELIAAQQLNSDRDAIAEAWKSQQLVVSLSGDPPVAPQ